MVYVGLQTQKSVGNHSGNINEWSGLNARQDGAVETRANWRLSCGKWVATAHPAHRLQGD